MDGVLHRGRLGSSWLGLFLSNFLFFFLAEVPHCRSVSIGCVPEKSAFFFTAVRIFAASPPFFSVNLSIKLTSESVSFSVFFFYSGSKSSFYILFLSFVQVAIIITTFLNSCFKSVTFEREFTVSPARRRLQ